MTGVLVVRALGCLACCCVWFLGMLKALWGLAVHLWSCISFIRLWACICGACLLPCRSWACWSPTVASRAFFGVVKSPWDLGVLAMAQLVVGIYSIVGKHAPWGKGRLSCSSPLVPRCGESVLGGRNASSGGYPLVSGRSRPLVSLRVSRRGETALGCCRASSGVGSLVRRRSSAW